MKMKVTDRGVTIPKQMLEGVQEIEVRQEGDRIIVIPLETEDPSSALEGIRQLVERPTHQLSTTATSKWTTDPGGPSSL